MFYLGKLRNYIIFCNLYSKGIMRENLAEYKEALHYLFLALSMNNNSLKCYKAIARTHRKNRQYPFAIDFYTKAIEKYPRNAELYALKADLHRKLKEYEMAIESYDKAIQLDYSNVEYYKMRSQIKYYTGDIQGAINDITSAIQWKKDYKLYAQRGFYKLEKQNIDSAFDDYTEAIKLAPQNANLYFMRYCINTLKNDKQSAENDYNIAIKLNHNINE